MRKHKVLTGAIFITGGLLATTAFADTDERGKHDADMKQKGKELSFQKLDQDGDGYISQSEFEQVDIDKRVDHASLDMDNDGQLDRTEFAAFEQLASDEKGRQGSQTHQPEAGYSETTHPRYGEESGGAASDWETEESTGDDY